ncbi:MAG: hypothetical protein C5S45_03475 [Candidatus Methanocomedens sp.]|nr:MAG: hypothetical protein C5S45_03475 [ANME-2 cluster archaeon]
MVKRLSLFGFDKFPVLKIPCLDICTYPYLPVNMVSTSNKREKIIATENTEITEDFFSVSSVLSVADKYKQ